MARKADIVITDYFCIKNQEQNRKIREYKCTTNKNPVSVASFQINIPEFLLITRIIPTKCDIFSRPREISPCTTTSDWRSPWARPPPTLEPTSRNYSQGQCWAYTGLQTNKLAKTINGHRRLGYNIAMWNCRKGLLNYENEASSELVDMI